MANNIIYCDDIIPEEISNIPYAFQKLSRGINIYSELNNKLNNINLNNNLYDKWNFANSAKKIINYCGSGYNVIVIPAKIPFFKGICNKQCEDISTTNDPDDLYQQSPIWLSDIRTAQMYATDDQHTISLYYSVRPLILIEITDETNMTTLFEKIKNLHNTTRNDVKYARQMLLLSKTLGIGTHIGIQHKLLKDEGKLYTPKNPNRIFSGIDPQHTSTIIKRISYMDLDKILVEILREHFPFVDGYYGREVHSPMHIKFHREVCIFGANGKLYNAICHIPRNMLYHISQFNVQQIIQGGDKNNVNSKENSKNLKNDKNSFFIKTNSKMKEENEYNIIPKQNMEYEFDKTIVDNYYRDILCNNSKLSEEEEFALKQILNPSEMNITNTKGGSNKKHSKKNN